jgi:hypothetical protein
MTTTVQVCVADVMLWLVGGLVVGLDEVLGTGLEGGGFWARSLHGSLYLFAENISIRHTFKKTLLLSQFLQTSFALQPYFGPSPLIPVQTPFPTHSTTFLPQNKKSLT